MKKGYTPKKHHSIKIEARYITKEKKTEMEDEKKSKIKKIKIKYKFDEDYSSFLENSLKDLKNLKKEFNNEKLNTLFDKLISLKENELNKD